MMQRVLVVDSNAEVRNVIEDLLFDQGFTIRQAANADDALMALREDAPDVLLCHLTLLRSERGGLSRRALEPWPALRIVAMSASGGQARSDEASVSLSKPFTRSQLLEAIRPR